MYKGLLLFKTAFLNTILHGQNDDMLSRLISHCDNERLEQKNNTRRIGF